MRDPDGTAYVLHVVGWLEGEGVEELLRVVDDARPGLVLDLSELRMADALGIEALESLAVRGVSLTQVPPLIALMLDSGSE
jgi:anti-anti-sigma regulatory factor